MKVNVGGIDRLLRITGGVVLIGLVVMGQIGWWGWLGAAVRHAGLQYLQDLLKAHAPPAGAPLP
jgi:hypothetical protein